MLTNHRTIVSIQWRTRDQLDAHVDRPEGDTQRGAPDRGNARSPGLGRGPAARPPDGRRRARVPAYGPRAPGLAAAAGRREGPPARPRPAGPRRRGARLPGLRRERPPLPERQHPPAVLGLGHGYGDALHGPRGDARGRGESERERLRRRGFPGRGPGAGMARGADGLSGDGGRPPRERWLDGEPRGPRGGPPRPRWLRRAAARPGRRAEGHDALRVARDPQLGAEGGGPPGARPRRAAAPAGRPV